MTRHGFTKNYTVTINTGFLQKIGNPIALLLLTSHDKTPLRNRSDDAKRASQLHYQRRRPSRIMGGNKTGWNGTWRAVSATGEKQLVDLSGVCPGGRQSGTDEKGADVAV